MGKLTDRIEVERLFWRIRAGNGRILVTSEQYSSHYRCEQVADRYYLRHQATHNYVNIWKERKKRT